MLDALKHFLRKLLLTYQMQTMMLLLQARFSVKTEQDHAKTAEVQVNLDTGEMDRPPTPPDVSAVNGILSSYNFLFGSPGHY
jgi:hypothetical protein